MELKKNVVIVGGCIAAKEAANAIRKNDLLATITMISLENYLPYYRPMLSRAIGQELTKSRLYLAPESWYKENDINLILGTEISQILPDENRVVATNGDTYDYTHLVIATGSSNYVPIPNATDIEGVISIRDYDDIIKLRSLLPKVKKAVVVGSGLLGIEAAWELQQQDINVKLIEFASHVLPKQLDLEASDFLTEHIAERGTELVCSSAAENILTEDGVVKGVKCSTGEEHPCDLLIFSIGAYPNMDLVKDTKIATDRGIIVNKHMQTNIPNIYAAGDVAQNEYNTSGIWVPAMEMGKIAGANIANKEVSYKPLFSSTMLTAFDTKIFSIGEFSNEVDVSSKTIIDPKRKFFKKIFAKDGFLIGAILIGDISEGTRLAKNLGIMTLEEAKALIA
ncbi:MAG TPA: NAD(P)/FAD-dependent oxidoreductase [Epulopiscium sp.]|nr:NAD(P)/FAD-dependent oxidoreductase [Candidatus Epulonipiscium sp.]